MTDDTDVKESQVSAGSDTGLPTAGWYEDPADGGRVRWWDGTAWTQHTRIHPASVEQPAVEQPTVEQPAVVQQAVGQPAVEPVAAPMRPRRSAQPAASVTQPVAPAPIVAPPAAWVAPPPAPPLAPPPARRYGGGLYDPSYDVYRGKNSAAAWALALGIISAALLLLREVLGYAPGLTGVGAVIWGIVGISRSKHIGVGRARSVWGLVLGALSLVVSIVSYAVLAVGMIGPNYDRAALENAIVQTYSNEGALAVTAACPTAPPFAAGSTFECTATDTSGAVHPVRVSVTDDKGSLSYVATR